MYIYRKEVRCVSNYGKVRMAMAINSVQSSLRLNVSVLLSQGNSLINLMSFLSPACTSLRLFAYVNKQSLKRDKKK
jgi:hypothetical protein